MTTMTISTLPTSSNSAVNALRFLAPIPLGAIMTMILLYAMYSLVRNDTLAPPTTDSVPIPSVIADFEKTIPVMQEQEPPVKPEIREQPPQIVIDTEIEDPTPTIGQGWKNVDVVFEKTTGINLGSGDQPMPIVRINPAYPANALSRGTEGYVDVMFDITPMGTTTNIRVIAFSPSSVFNSAVIKAVRGWKYKPASDGENTFKTQDVTERINFQLEK